jgi:adenosylcobinamide-GDP ribazoletransferase
MAPLVVAALCSIFCAWVARRQLGGHTGDFLGAAEVLAECAVLTVLTA